MYTGLRDNVPLQRGMGRRGGKRYWRGRLEPSTLCGLQGQPVVSARGWERPMAAGLQGGAISFA